MSTESTPELPRSPQFGGLLGSAGPCPICGDPGCMGNECSPPDPSVLDCYKCSGRGHTLGVDCDCCDGTGDG